MSDALWITVLELRPKDHTFESQAALGTLGVLNF